MKTKYILHGGFPPNTIQVNDEFFSEILKEVSQVVNVLLVFFASTEIRIPRYIEEDKEQFTKNKLDKTIFFDVAQENIFLKQLEKADVIYFHGGTTSKLLNVLKKFPDLEKSFRGKVIAGDSAGVKALSNFFYSEKTGVSEGLGIIPVKLICHFEDRMKNVFNNTHPEIKTIMLKESEFKVIEL